ncbi:MAG: type II toxin-antitoxin system RelB/DinJ family antitoxin [Lachnospiraceae bacterium]|nr:type II toxin-antitoxin system RelB/DinJ family antitoxin [Lachnospiraceae bacterium]
MAQATFSIRMDEALKKRFDELCSEFGMNATTAFNIFARAVVRERRIPFEIKAENADSASVEGLKSFYDLQDEARRNGIQDMPLSEINEEISRVRDMREK